MARNVNFLIGQGERLTRPVEIKKGSGPKNAPYSIDVAKRRMARGLEGAMRQFSSLPASACPENQVVAVLTMHPRYTAKSEFPNSLLERVGLHAIGTRARILTPDEWGIKSPPVDGRGVAEDVFVSGARQAFESWRSETYAWQDQQALSQICHVEMIDAFRAQDKVKGLPEEREEAYFEVVLHNDLRWALASEPTNRILDAFEAYSIDLGCRPLMDRSRSIGGIVFLPVFAPVAQIEELAAFTFLRVARGMPSMRPAKPTVLRAGGREFSVVLPDHDAVDPSIRAVLFDGGLPLNHPLSRWVNYFEPEGIGTPAAGYQEHGLGVTSAFLFGPLVFGVPPPRPLCNVDHVRVLDSDTGSAGDIECYDVLDRITEHLAANEPYEFIGLSLGPRYAVDDNDISRWTVELDQCGAGGKCLITTAAGNDGELDASSGLNRVQPPADGVNVLSIGASDSQGFMWQRAPYSCVGPGRSPGLMKPDGVGFGGCAAEPFSVLSARRPGFSESTGGTSYSTPYVNRSGISVRAQLGQTLSPLAIRALLVQRAERYGKEAVQVGWGQFETDPELLITCDDNEALVVYQGELPVKQHLRADVPLPGGILTGRLTISATLLIAPDLDPANSNAYTRGGFGVSFRPNQSKKYKKKDGSYSIHAQTVAFFSPHIMWGDGSIASTLRGDAYKWEPCQKGIRQFDGKSLDAPAFDIYHETRAASGQEKNPKPISYALVIGVRADGIPDYYNRVVRQYSGVLQQILPVNRLRV